jgi:hypothetical protein
MRLDLSHSIVSEPFLGVFMQELFQQVLDQRGQLELAVKYLGEVRGFADDGFEELHSVLVFEGRVTSEHFMNKAAETPPINISAVSDFFYDLRRKVFRSATKRHCNRVLRVEYFGKSEVSKLKVSILINDNILGFEAV